MPYEISKPAAGGSGLALSDHVGALMVFIGCALEPDFPTTYGKTNAARVQIAVPLDGERAGEVFYDNLLFGKVMVPSLTNAGGDIVVGRLVLGTAKAGQNAPYRLEDPTPDEETAVVKWLEQNIKEDEAGRYSVVGVSPGDDEAPFV